MKCLNCINITDYDDIRSARCSIVNLEILNVNEHRECLHFIENKKLKFRCENCRYNISNFICNLVHMEIRNLSHCCDNYIQKVSK